MHTISKNDRVIWTASINNPGLYMPREKIPGTVLTVFDNGGVSIYKVKLDMTYPERITSKIFGSPVIVGNVRKDSLAPIATG